MFRPIALALCLTTITLPAAAGSIEYYWTPRTQQGSATGEVGMLAHAIARKVKNRARVSQAGDDLTAGIRQSGTGNRALINQRGTGHTGSIDQQGINNGFALIQRGRGTTADVSQYGTGGKGVLFQFGW